MKKRIDIKIFFSILTFLIINVMFSSSAPIANATVIFNNFGPGDTFNLGEGHLISHTDAAPYYNYVQGNSFTPTGSNYTLDTIELAAWLGAGANQLDVWLMNDNSGTPGAIIETFNFVDAMLSDPGTILTANSVLHPNLLAGTQYWLVASAPALGTIIGWNYNSTGYAGLHAWSREGEPWNIDGRNASVFRITGSAAVPEPSTLLLLGSGIAGFAVTRIKKFRKSA